MSIASSISSPSSVAILVQGRKQPMIPPAILCGIVLDYSTLGDADTLVFIKSNLRLALCAVMQYGVTEAEQIKHIGLQVASVIKNLDAATVYTVAKLCDLLDALQHKGCSRAQTIHVCEMVLAQKLRKTKTLAPKQEPGWKPVRLAGKSDASAPPPEAEAWLEAGASGWKPVAWVESR